MRAFMQQAGDGATVLEMDDGGVAGGLAKVRGLFGFTTVAVGGTTAALLLGTAVNGYGAVRIQVNGFERQGFQLLGRKTVHSFSQEGGVEVGEGQGHSIHAVIEARVPSAILPITSHTNYDIC